MSEAASSPVLVVIPCLNEEAHLDGLLRQILRDPAAERFRVVVADGGSTDSSRRIVSEFARVDRRVVLLDNPQKIQSAGVNRAVAVHGADCEHLIRIDAHAGYPHGYGSSLLATAERTGADSVVVSMVSEGFGCFQKAAAAAQNSVLGAGGSRHRKTGEGGWIDHGHHALMRLDAYRRAGGYDESFVANEDAELDARIVQAGGRIWLSGETAVTYYPRSDARRLFRQYLNYGAGRVRTLRKHRLKPKARQMLPLAVAPALALAPLGLLHPVFAAPALLWAAACVGYGLLLGLKARDACAAVSGVPAMIMHLAWSIGFLREALRVRRSVPAPAAAPAE